MEDAKRLERSIDNKIFLGVCAGIAEYFGIDPLFVRILFILLALTHGSGILLYLFLAVVMPKEGQDHAHHQKRMQDLAQDIRHSAEHVSHQVKAHFKQDYKERKRLNGLFGWVIVLVGILILVEAALPKISFFWQAVFAALMVLFGITIITRR